MKITGTGSKVQLKGARLCCVSLVCLNTLVASFNGGHRDNSTPLYASLLYSTRLRLAALRLDRGKSRCWIPRRSRRVDSPRELATHFREMFDLLDGILKCKRHLYSLLYKDPICILRKNIINMIINLQKQCRICSLYCKMCYFFTYNTVLLNVIYLSNFYKKNLII